MVNKISLDDIGRTRGVNWQFQEALATCPLTIYGPRRKLLRFENDQKSNTF